MRHNPTSAAAASSRDKKISIFLLSQIHGDEFPIKTAEEIVEFGRKQNLQMVVGFEYSDGFEKLIENECRFLDLRSKFFHPSSSAAEKQNCLVEMQAIEPLTTFVKSVGNREMITTLGLEKAASEFLQTNPAVLRRVNNEAFTRSQNQLIKKCTPNCFPIEDARLSEQLMKTRDEYRLAGKDLTALYAEYEDRRINCMNDKITSCVTELNRNDDPRNTVILVCNLGFNHVQNLQAKLTLANVEDPNIDVSYLVMASQHIASRSASWPKFCSENPAKIFPTNDLYTETSIFDEEMLRVFSHVGVEEEKIKLQPVVSNAAGPLPPKGSIIGKKNENTVIMPLVSSSSVIKR